MSVTTMRDEAVEPIVEFAPACPILPQDPELLDWLGHVKAALAARGHWSTTLIVGECFKVNTIHEDRRGELVRLALEYAAVL